MHALLLGFRLQPCHVTYHSRGQSSLLQTCSSHGLRTEEQTSPPKPGPPSSQPKDSNQEGLASMRLDPSMTSTSGQRLQVSPPWGASNGRLTREGRISQISPTPEGLAGPSLLCTARRAEGPMPWPEKQSILDASLSPGCRRRALSLASQARLDL